MKMLILFVTLLSPMCVRADSITFTKDPNAFVSNDAVLWPGTGWTRGSGNIWTLQSTTERGYAFVATYIGINGFPPPANGLLGDLILTFLAPIRGVGFNTDDRPGGGCNHPFNDCSVYTVLTTAAGQDFGTHVRVFGPEFLGFTDLSGPNIASVRIWGTETNEIRLLEGLGDRILIDVPEPPTTPLLGTGLLVVIALLGRHSKLRDSFGSHWSA